MIFFKRDKKVDHSECNRDIERIVEYYANVLKKGCRCTQQDLEKQSQPHKDLQALYENKVANYELLREENVTLRNMLGLKNSRKYSIKRETPECKAITKRKKYVFSGKYAGYYQKYHAKKNKVETK